MDLFSLVDQPLLSYSLAFFSLSTENGRIPTPTFSQSENLMKRRHLLKQAALSCVAAKSVLGAPAPMLTSKGKAEHVIFLWLCLLYTSDAADE